jgi:hypothetical protein
MGVMATSIMSPGFAGPIACVGLFAAHEAGCGARAEAPSRARPASPIRGLKLGNSDPTKTSTGKL